MLRKNIQKLGALIICVAMLLSMAACQKSPDSSLVVNKDFDKLIEEAEGTDTGKVKIEDIADIEYEDYVTSFEDSDLGVKVNVNAKVDIPKADHLSVFRVKQAPFTQDFIDKVRTELMGDTPIYDGYALHIETKGEIEDIITYWRAAMNETDDETIRAEYQERIDELQEEYEAAPAEIVLTDYPSDGKLIHSDDSTDPDSEGVFVVSDGSDGIYSSLRVNNSPKSSNKLEFEMNKVGHAGIMSSADIEPYIGDIDEILADMSNKEKPENYTGVDVVYEDSSPISYVQLKGETCTITEAEAISAADSLLEKLGLAEFSCYDSGIINSQFYCAQSQPFIVYRTHYAITYYRNIDGVFLTQSSGTKNNMSTGNDAMLYGKISWPGECITIWVNDDGIIGFSYSSPIEITETVVENAAIKSFEDVRDTFEKMMVVTNAGKYTTKVFDIDRVRLSYSRISEANSYDTGLIVPVWDFSGHCETASDGVIIFDGYKTALAINAIDGSIIDPDLGY